MAFCTECGKQLPSGARFCAACGRPVRIPAAAASPESAPPAPAGAPEAATEPETRPVAAPDPTSPPRPGRPPRKEKAAKRKSRGGCGCLLLLLALAGAGVIAMIEYGGLDELQRAVEGFLEPSTPTPAVLPGTQAGAPVLPPPTGPEPAAGAEPAPAAASPSASGLSVGAVVAEAVVGPEGGVVSAPGRVTIEFPAGALGVPERVAIREVAAPGGAQVFQVERAGAGPLAKGARVQLRVPAGLAAAVGVQELDGPLFAEVPGSRYDAATGELSFEVHHFSMLGGITSADVKAFAGGLVGAAIGIYLVTPAGVLTLPGILVVSAAGLGGAAVTNPIVDAVAFREANMVVQFGDRFRIHWVDDKAKPSHLEDDRLVAWANAASSAIVAFGDQLTDAQKAQLASAGRLVDASGALAEVKQVGIPKCVVHTAAELFWSQTFYAKAGFATPAGGDDPMPRPMEVLVLSDPSNQGLWDGSKLNLDSNVVARISVLQKEHHVTRQAVIAHEYWHAVYTFAGYSAPWDWFNEAMAVAFESEVFPERNIFVADHPAPEVATSLRTGFAATGTQGTDADWSKRGYKLWPWGKFLLQRGYRTAIDCGRGSLGGAETSRLFGEFGLALVCSDKELPDKAVVATPSDAFNRSGYVVQYPEGMSAASFDKSISTTTGWASLNLDQMMSSLVLGLGDAGQAGGDDVRTTPVALSFTLLKATVSPPKAVIALANAKTPPPLVVRRSQPDSQETVVALHPTSKHATTARRPLSDLTAGAGTHAPGAWFDWTQTATLDLALINTAQSAGSRNPLWVYFLLPPGNVTATKIGNQRRGASPEGFTADISEPQVVLSWKHPDPGPGLAASQTLAGYRVFTRAKQGEPRMAEGVLLPTDAEAATVPISRVGDYEHIGLAAEDAVLKDAEGRPLLSPVQWYAPGNGTVTAYVSEVNPNNRNPFAEDITLPVSGASVSIEYTDKGVPASRSGTTDAKGEARFEVPLDVPITVVHRNERRTVTCTPSAPRQFTGFGGLKIPTVSTIPPADYVPPPPPIAP